MEELLKKSADALIAAVGRRSRYSQRCMFALATIGVLGLAAVWRTTSLGWTLPRLNGATAAYAFFEYCHNENLAEAKDLSDRLILLNKFSRESDNIPAELACGLKSDAENYFLRLKGKILEIDGEEGVSPREEFLLSGLSYVLATSERGRPIVNQAHIKSVLDAYTRIKVTDVDVVRLPVFGLSFDVNNLTLIMGLVTFGGLLTLRFSLRAEKSATIRFKNCLAAVPENERKSWLTIAATEQKLFTSWPKRGKWPHWLDITAIGLVTFPTAILALALANDLRTVERGRSLSEIATDATIGTGVTSVGACLVLTVLCLHARSEISAAWHEFFTNISFD
ncbi:MAG: hypothetical protein AAF532_08115 [Planctomycetota bacterium]